MRTCLLDAEHEAHVLQTVGDGVGVPRLLGFGQTQDGRFVLAMDRLAGRPMSRGIEPSAKAVDLALAACGAEEVLQNRGYVDGDLHPGNLLVEQSVSAQPKAHIIDLGTAVPLDQSGIYKGPRLGGDWSIQAPEQFPDAHNQVTLTRASDVYFLGADLAQSLTGREVFDPGVSRDDWGRWVELSKQRRNVADPIPEVPSGPLKDVVLKALKPNPQERFQSAAEWKAALQEAQRKDPICQRTVAIEYAPGGDLVVGGQAMLVRLGAPWTTRPRRRLGRVNRLSAACWCGTGRRIATASKTPGNRVPSSSPAAQPPSTHSRRFLSSPAGSSAAIPSSRVATFPRRRRANPSR